MARYIILIISIFIFGCEITGQQIIKPEKFKFNEINFDTVSKDLSYQIPLKTQEEITYAKIIDQWINDKIKVNGFEGNLEIHVKELQILKFKEDSYYKVEIKLLISFKENYKISSKSNLYEVESFEYGEIKGGFSITDQENLDINIMYKNLNNVSRQLENIL